MQRKTCPCGTEFTPRTPKEKYHTNACARKYGTKMFHPAKYEGNWKPLGNLFERIVASAQRAVDRRNKNNALSNFKSMGPDEKKQRAKELRESANDLERS